MLQKGPETEWGQTGIGLSSRVVGPPPAPPHSGEEDKALPKSLDTLLPLDPLIPEHPSLDRIGRTQTPSPFTREGCRNPGSSGAGGCGRSLSSITSLGARRSHGTSSLGLGHVIVVVMGVGQHWESDGITVCISVVLAAGVEVSGQLSRGIQSSSFSGRA